MKIAVHRVALLSPPENISALSPSKAGLLKPWTGRVEVLGHPAGSAARKIMNLMDPFFWVAVVVGAGVVGMTIYVAVRFRERPGDDRSPVQTHGNIVLEISWTIIPFLILAVMAVPTVATIFNLAKIPKGPNVIHVENIMDILHELQKKLNAASSHLEIEFPYFMSKRSPVSRKESLMDYIARFDASACGAETDFVLTVKVNVTTLCPCSKAIAKYGAHNQRGEVTVALRSTKVVWIEDVVTMVEGAASSELYALLKRQDEKAVTERAYENPVFVEDLVRNVALRLNADARAAAGAGHQLRRDPDDGLAGDDQVGRQSPAQLATVLEGEAALGEAGRPADELEVAAARRPDGPFGHLPAGPVDRHGGVAALVRIDADDDHLRVAS